MDSFIQMVIAHQGTLLSALFFLTFVLFVLKRQLVASWVERLFGPINYQKLSEEQLARRLSAGSLYTLIGIITLPLLIFSPMAADDPSLSKLEATLSVIFVASIPILFIISGIVIKKKVQHEKQNRPPPT
jgi:uncharacterized membrane protein